MADLKRVSGLLTRPRGIGIRSAVTGRPGFRGGPARSCPPPTGPQKTTRAQRPRPQRKSEPPHAPKPETQPGEAPGNRAAKKLSFPSGEVGGDLTPAPRAPPCACRQIGSGPATGRAGGEDGRLPRDGEPGSAASCRGGGRAGAEGPRATNPVLAWWPLQWEPPAVGPRRRSFIFVW